MWYDELEGRSWASLWSGYVLCGGSCLGIRQVTSSCPACDGAPYDLSPQTLIVDGKEIRIPLAFMGAEGRYEDYIYLQILQREWERPASEFELFAHFTDADRPSARAALVLLFWSYFETRIERLLRTAMRALPPRILEDQLRRYSGIGRRLYDLYKIFFGVTYFEDLGEQGFDNIASLLRDLHGRRNDFAHGRPQAINEASVVALVENLKTEHEAWISVFNWRIRPTD